MSLEQNFPQASGPALEPTGQFTQEWLAFFRALWNRTGEGPGTDPANIAVLGTLASALSVSTDPRARAEAGAAFLMALRPVVGPVNFTEAKLFALSLARPAPPTAFAPVIQASEALTAGNFTNVYSSTGALRVRKADATDPTKFANSFTLTGIGNGLTGPIQFAGLNSKITVSTPASEVWLSDTVPGGVTATPPTTTGYLLQTVGTALPDIGVAFAQGTYTIL